MKFRLLCVSLLVSFFSYCVLASQVYVTYSTEEVILDTLGPSATAVATCGQKDQYKMLSGTLGPYRIPDATSQAICQWSVRIYAADLYGGEHNSTGNGRKTNYAIGIAYTQQTFEILYTINSDGTTTIISKQATTAPQAVYQRTEQFPAGNSCSSNSHKE